MPAPSRRLGEILVADYHVLESDVRLAIQAQKQGQPDRLGQFLVRRGILTDRDLVTALGQQLAVPVVLGLPRLDIAADVLQLVPIRCAEKKLVMPVSLIGKTSCRRLVLAMADPTDDSVVEALERLNGFGIVPAIATEEDLRRAFKVFYLGERSHADPAELTGSFEMMRLRLRGGTRTSAPAESSRPPTGTRHSGELVRPKPLPLESVRTPSAFVPLGEDDPIPMPDRSVSGLTPEPPTRVSQPEPHELESRSLPAIGAVLPRDPDFASSTLGA